MASQPFEKGLHRPYLLIIDFTKDQLRKDFTFVAFEKPKTFAFMICGLRMRNRLVGQPY